MGEFGDVLGWEGRSFSFLFGGLYVLEGGGLMNVVIDCFPDCPAWH